MAETRRWVEVWRPPPNPAPTGTPNRNKTRRDLPKPPVVDPFRGPERFRGEVQRHLAVRRCINSAWPLALDTAVRPPREGAQERGQSVGTVGTLDGGRTGATSDGMRIHRIG
jgi:hypothetical protein